jgi:hypothetical protein
VIGTSATDLTGYFSVFRVLPLKMMLESISTILNRNMRAMVFLLLNHVSWQKVIRMMAEVMNKMKGGWVPEEKGVVEN